MWTSWGGQGGTKNGEKRYLGVTVAPSFNCIVTVVLRMNFEPGTCTAGMVGSLRLAEQVHGYILITTLYKAIQGLFAVISRVVGHQNRFVKKKWMQVTV